MSNSLAYIVLGASGDTGAALSHQLRSNGQKVFLASRASESLTELAASLDSPYYELDATNLDDVEACFTEAHHKLGNIDGVVNCVGSLLLKPAHLTKGTEWEETIATNLTSAFATVRSAAKVMSDTGGSVVLVSSAAARVGIANHEAIAAAKAGIIGLTKSAAASYAGRGLRFNAIAPGLIKTKLTKKIWGNDRTAANSTAMHALGRLGTPEEVASLISFLLNPNNSWITGEVFSIDGGLANILCQHKGKAS